MELLDAVAKCGNQLVGRDFARGCWVLVQRERVEPVDATRVLFFVAEHALNGVPQVVRIGVADKDIGLSDILGLEDFHQGALVGGGGFESELLLQLPSLHLEVSVVGEKVAEELGIDTLARTDHLRCTFCGRGLTTARTGELRVWLILLGAFGFCAGCRQEGRPRWRRRRRKRV